MKLVNPLYYPLSILVGGITLVIGVRILGISSLIMLPLSGAIATTGAIIQKNRQAGYNLNNPQLEQELLLITQRAKELAKAAKLLYQEALGLLGTDVDLLAAVQLVCDRAIELPIKIDNMGKRLQGSDSLFSVNELQQQLAEVNQKISSSSGIAKEHLEKLAQSLDRNITLARQGQDARQAQILSLSMLILDSAGLMQELQNKIRITDITNSTETKELKEFTAQLNSFQQNIDLLVSN